MRNYLEPVVFGKKDAFETADFMAYLLAVIQSHRNGLDLQNVIFEAITYKWILIHLEYLG